MLNRYFKADGNNPDFLYANISAQNIYFALISLDHILLMRFIMLGYITMNTLTTFFIYTAFLPLVVIYQMYFTITVALVEKMLPNVQQG